MRYEHPAPGDLVHVDVKKLGRIPDGGGHRVHGRAKGNRVKKNAKPGTAYIHHAMDDHSRLVYSEILTDERKETASEFWTRANAYFASCGITVLRVPTDIQSGWAIFPRFSSTGEEDGKSSGTCPSSLLDRVERTATPCLLTMLAGGRGHCRSPRCPVRNLATDSRD